MKSRKDILPPRAHGGALRVAGLIAGVVAGLAAGTAFWHGRAGQAMAGEPAAAPSAAVTKQDAPAPAAVKTLYTCGMHPEVVEDKPGNCPKCGMKLVPMDPDRARMILEARGESVAQAPAAPKERKILYWRSSMDPAYIRNEPGKDLMGMDLVAVYADETQGGPTIRIDPVTEQNMGLRYDVVRRGPVDRVIRTVATVAYDEQGLGTVTTKTDGWVEKVYVNETGEQVHKGDPLFEFYSPDLYSAQEEYLVALQDQSKAQSLGEAARMAEQRLRSARDRLLLFDIGQDQIDELEKSQTVRKTLTIGSQLTGIVTEKKMVEGDRLMAGMPAYKIADLSNVWVMGKVYESDLPYIKLGQEVQMTLDYLPGRTYVGRITYIYPYLDQATREIPVRVEFHNPGYDLKPGMYATIEINSQVSADSVLVPDMAVINTGTREVAFVSAEPGRFEPREVKTGARTGTNELQVLSGLAPGEKVVVSGQFLLDSESRLREAALKMLKPGLVNTNAIFAKGPAEEVKMAMPGSAPAASQPAPKALKYVCPMPAHAGILYDKPGDCPLCGMKLVPVQPWQEQESPVAFYTCPMPEHSMVRSDKPGNCPLCGMTLIPVTRDEASRFQQVKPSEIPKTLYTCPMPADADVVSDKPGDCPKCGMKLVPTSSVPHGKQAEELWHKERPTTGTLTLKPAAPAQGETMEGMPGMKPGT